MSDEKRTTTIELTADDRRYARALCEATGIITTIGVLRFALRSAVAHNVKATKVYDALLSPGISAMEVAQGELEL